MSNRQKDNVIKDTENQKDKYVLLKSHKLSAALYMVTNFMSDMDPLKWTLRDKSITVFSQITSDNPDQALAEVNQIVALIDIGLMNPGVSEMNFAVLQREYSVLKDVLAERRQGRISGLVAGASVDAAGAADDLQRQILPPGQNRGLNQGQKRRSRLTNPATVIRRQAILEFIKQQPDWVGVREICLAAPDCGSKTIQRELKELVKQGLLRKEGNKRWSRYSPAPAV